MISLTKQDVQNIMDSARVRLSERMVTRQDMQVLQENIKALTYQLQQCQQLLRQEEYQRVQLIRRAVASETRMSQIEHEIQNVRRSIVQLAQQQPTERVTERVIMAQPKPNGQQGYAYNPNPA